MRRKLVIICMAACMLCLAIGCGTGKDNNVADESTSARKQMLYQNQLHLHTVRHYLVSSSKEVL